MMIRNVTSPTKINGESSEKMKIRNFETVKNVMSHEKALSFHSSATCFVVKIDWKTFLKINLKAL